MSVRTATRADLSQVAALERACFPQDPLPMIALVQYHALFGDLFVVVDAPDGLAAYGVAGLTAAAETGSLLGAAVAPAARGQGLGAAVTEALVARLRARGALRILATVAPANTASRRMLAAAGLTVQEELQDYFGPGEARLLMSWTAPDDA